MPENISQKDISEGIETLSEIRWLLDSWMEFRIDHPEGISPESYVYSCPGHCVDFQVEPEVYSRFNADVRKRFIEIMEHRTAYLLERISFWENITPPDDDSFTKFAQGIPVWDELSPMAQHMLANGRAHFGPDCVNVDLLIPNPFLRIGQGQRGDYERKRYRYRLPEAEVPADPEVEMLFLAARAGKTVESAPETDEKLRTFYREIFHKYFEKQLIDELRSQEQLLCKRISEFKELSREEQELWVIEEYGAWATLNEVEYWVKQEAFYRRAVERTKFHHMILRFPWMFAARWNCSVGKEDTAGLEGYKDFIPSDEVRSRVKAAMAGLQDVVVRKFAERPPWGYSTNLIPQGATAGDEFKPYENLRMQIREYRAERVGLIPEDSVDVGLGVWLDPTDDDSWPNPIELPEELRLQQAMPETRETGIEPIFPMGDLDWVDLTITFIALNEDDIKVKLQARGKSGRFSLEKLGLYDRDKKRMTMSGAVLLSYAQRRSYAQRGFEEVVVPLTTAIACANNPDHMRQIVRRLRKRLQAITGLSTDPFDEGGNSSDGWVLRCELRYDDRDYAPGDDALSGWRERRRSTVDIERVADPRGQPQQDPS